MSNHNSASCPAIHFPDEKLASFLVAGLPCAVRVVLKLQQDGAIGKDAQIALLCEKGWENQRIIESELRRISPGVTITFATAPSDYPNVINGLDAISSSDTSMAGHSHRALLNAASKEAIKATGKESDGLVSRHINRPISQFLSYYALKLNGFRPIHGTIAAAVLGLVMALCLLFGGLAGLYAGAVLFQLASIVDGVDGEVARATHRASKTGASLDSACDAVTNFAFIAGVSFNLWQQGYHWAGQAGFAGLTLLFIGLAILGGISLARGEALNFDAAKRQAQGAPSPLMQGLAKVTSRDVYALVLAVLILIGLAAPAMMVFAAAIAIWFIVAMAMLIKR